MSETTTDAVPVDVLEEAEWNPPRGGFQKKPNPYAAIVAEAAKTGKAYSLTFTLDGKTAEEQTKEIGAELRKMRRAGDELDPPKTVASYAGEVNKKDNSVVITFKCVDKIRRERSAEDNGTSESAA